MPSVFPLPSRVFFRGASWSLATYLFLTVSFTCRKAGIHHMLTLFIIVALVALIVGLLLGIVLGSALARGHYAHIEMHRARAAAARHPYGYGRGYGYPHGAREPYP